MNERTLRSSKNKTLVSMGDDSAPGSPASTLTTSLTDNLATDSGVASGMASGGGAGPAPPPGMEHVLAMMAKMMVDSRLRDERRQEELERKLDERDRLREEREKAEKREKDDRDEQRKRDEERRALAEETKSQQAELFHLQQLELMREIKKDEDKRQRDFQEKQREWKERLEASKALETKISNALRTFPKINSLALLPSQINNFEKLMRGLEATEDAMISRLPEVLSGTPATTYQNLTGDNYTTFKDLKDRFLTAAGITFSSAGKAFVKPDLEALRKMTAVDLWCHIKGMVERILAGATTVKEGVSVLCMTFLNVFGTSNLIMSLAGCSQVKEDEVQQALLKTHEAFGQVISSESGSVKRKIEVKSGNSRCDVCNKAGHKAADCWSKPRGKPNTTCYTCGKEGHISFNCPEKGQGSKGPEAGSKNTSQDSKKKGGLKNSVVKEPLVETCNVDSMMTVTISGRSLRVLPDSGAQVSVIPPSLVAPCEYTGDMTCLVDFEGMGDRQRKIAVVDITVGGTTFRERVAVSNHLGESGLLCLPILDQNKSSCILSEFYRQKAERVNAVQTRAATKTLEELESRENAVVAEEAASLRGADAEILDRSLVLDHQSGEGTNGDLVQEAIGIGDSECPESVKPDGCDSIESVAEGEHPVSTPVSAERSSRPVSAESSGQLAQLDCLVGGEDREEFIELVKSDPTLAACRRLGSQKLRGYSWDHGLLVHQYLNELGEEVQRLVVPEPKRRVIMELAHDKMGHLGHRKLRDMVGQRFTWPRVGSDLEAHVLSCQCCQVASKRGQCKVPLVERPILSEPFEAVAVDLVGPFPLAKGRFRYLLTSVCLATRWPEVVTLRSITAKSVADGLLNIFSHTGLPFVVLADNGSQFTGKLMRELSDILGVEVKHSSPYHPEANGMLERMHSTLGSMLKKASERGLDWAEQVPFALFALRQMPCRSTGFSPYELVWGAKMHTPLDVLYKGWRERRSQNLQVSEWMVKLIDKLEVLRDLAVDKAKQESGRRKAFYDRGKVDRTYSPGDKVLVRVAGLNGKLTSSWEGPYEVTRVLSDVNYSVKLIGGKRVRKIHVNLMKTYRVREKVGGVTVLATEEGGAPEGRVVVCGDVIPNVLEQVHVVLDDFKDLLDGEPGVFTGEPLSVTVVEGASPVSTKPYRIPDAIKPKVKEALDSLIERGWVVRSSSPWASPIVPVAKPDGSVRLCVNYKRLNDVTSQQQYPIPHFDDILGEVGQAKVLSKMDLMKGYHQVPLTQECQELTGFITPWGSYKFTVLPFGLKNAPAQFQSLMVDVLAGCKGYALVYIDDVLVYSQEEDQHAGQVRQVLEAIRESGLKLNPKKCCWARCKVEFLGHVVGAGKVSVPAARVKALQEFIRPVTRKDLRAALGTFGYYRKFIPNYAHITSDLNQATSSKATHRVQWTPEMDRDFSKLKSCVCDVVSLCVPCEGDGFVLHTDASGRGIGSVLYVLREGEKLPVAFFSKPVRGAEIRYSATELEALAILRSVEHFVPYLYGRRFEVVTDHAPLCGLMTSPNLNRRLRGFMLKLLEFDFSIVYRPGEENGDADGLSRQAWIPEEGEDSCGSSLSESAIISGGRCGNPHPK